MMGVQRSASISEALAIGQYWPYVRTQSSARTGKDPRGSPFFVLSIDRRLHHHRGLRQGEEAERWVGSPPRWEPPREPPSSDTSRPRGVWEPLRPGADRAVIGGCVPTHPAAGARDRNRGAGPLRPRHRRGRRVLRPVGPRAAKLPLPGDGPPRWGSSAPIDYSRRVYATITAELLRDTLDEPAREAGSCRGRFDRQHLGAPLRDGAPFPREEAGIARRRAAHLGDQGAALHPSAPLAARPDHRPSPGKAEDDQDAARKDGPRREPRGRTYP